MNKFVRKHLKEIFVAVASVLSFILIACALILINNFSNGLYKQAVDAVDHHGEEYQNMLDGTFSNFVEESYSIAERFPTDYTTSQSFVGELKEETQSIGKIFIVTTDGQIKDAEYPVGTTEGDFTELLNEAKKKNELGVSGVYDSNNTEYGRLFGVYVPVNRGNVRAIAVFYHHTVVLSRLKDDFSRLKTDTPAQYIYVCLYPDEILSVLDAGPVDLAKSSVTEHDSLKKYLRELTDKSTVDLIDEGINDEKGISHEVLINGTRYVICIKPSKLAGKQNYVVAIYNSYNVYAEGHELASALGAIIVVVVVIIVALAIYILLVRFKLAKQVDTYDLEDPVYGCPNFRFFSNKAEELLDKNKVTKYAVIYTEIAHFSYIEETFGSKATDEALKFLIKVYEKALLEDEVFARINDDRFCLLFHYGNEDELRGRLKTLSSLAYHCPALKKYEFYLRLNIGVCIINREEDNSSIQKYLDRAIIARRANLAEQNDNIRIYSEKVHETFMLEAEIETKMEAALRNNEFKMFYQPKYNIERNRPDGCEALVRWYDAENNRFRPPSEFLPLFESNGFIAELDKYVMNEVCKFIAESLSRGYRMIPISVNVSRVTASQAGFIEYYVATKRKYGIRDKFLTIEFTESFAYENYDVISNIVNKFHASGFECSIDDFGSGFSSYNILKELPMDEIKLDRFFIKPGISKERDDNLLKSIISLAKQMNMKVTQEGVETVEDLKRLKDFGCDVVQGYIYAKPMAATDFLEFIRSGGSIHIV